MRSDVESRTFLNAPRPGGRARANVGRWAAIGALVAAVAGVVPACTAAQQVGESPAFLMIDQLEASAGTQEKFSNSLSSDVQTDGGVFEDEGRVAFRLALKDPGSANSPTVPSTTNYITLTRYRVTYTRSDGRNTPGVNVPYPFDGGMTVTVDGTGGVGTFVLVRVQAKLEPPLIGLRNLSSSLVVSTIADVTFYGHDQAGRPVSAAGQISVNFADWADPE